jgi:hypothetical protein
MKQTWKHLYPAAAAVHDNDDDDIGSVLRRISFALFNAQQKYKS